MPMEMNWLPSARRPVPERGTPVRKFRNVVKYAAATAVLALAVAACSSNSSTSAPSAAATNGGCKSASQVSSVAALPGYHVCLLIPASSTANHPDSVVYAAGKLWIGWQNITAKDGLDNKSSTIGEYTTSGKLLKSWSIGGPTAGTGCHTDGMRYNTATNKLWVMCDEDGNPRLYLIDPTSGGPTQITLPKTPHGGGFDDIQFVNGKAFIDASNPTLNSAGKNVFPALYTVTISGTTAKITPVLKGGATGTTLNPPVTPITMPLTDPDSMMIDPQGDLVLDSQGDMQLLFIHNPGTASQTIKVLSVGTPVDDTVWPTSTKGCMIISDNASGVYSVCSDLWVTSTPLTSAPNDSTIISFVGELSVGSGLITPIIVGMNNPHGMAFIPQ
jgi:hypothetical protein